MASLPPELWATIACFAGDTPEGNVARAATGTVRIKHRDRKGWPYVNGLLHSWDGREPIVICPGPARYYQARYYCDGKLHRDDDQPAVVTPGMLEWYQHGQLHRDGDQPAVIAYYGYYELRKWYQRGLLHRDGDQPAVIDPDFERQWYQHGKVHRDNDQPAAIYVAGQYRAWMQQGKLHRDNDQPAIIHDNGGQEWYQHGQVQRRMLKEDYPGRVDESTYYGV
jgi:hypothetical protein